MRYRWFKEFETSIIEQINRSKMQTAHEREREWLLTQVIYTAQTFQTRVEYIYIINESL